MYDIGETGQARYQDFLRYAPEKVDGEAAILRVCIERAMRENRPALVKSLCDTLAKVASVSQAVKLREGTLLERSVALLLMKRLADAVCGLLREFAIPHYEQIVDRLIGDLDTVFEETLRAREQPLCLPAPNRVERPTRSEEDSTNDATDSVS
jgi:hypothetical protein